jgi:hypothetical protein
MHVENSYLMYTRSHASEDENRISACKRAFSYTVNIRILGGI